MVIPCKNDITLIICYFNNYKINYEFCYVALLIFFKRTFDKSWLDFSCIFLFSLVSLSSPNYLRRLLSLL